LFLFTFSEAQKLVEDMEKERRKLDKQLDIVQEKTKRAYLSQEILEAKMKVNPFKKTLKKSSFDLFVHVKHGFE
jgi:hypothetical protein